MSDHWIKLIPEDPRFVPDEAKRERARERFGEIAPDADEIEPRVTDAVLFIDAGENFDRVLCPACRSSVPLRWWQDHMDKDYVQGTGFKLLTYPVPCCGVHCTMHELVYDSAQGLGRFSLCAMNPNIGRLEERYRVEFEAILGTKLRVIYVHM